MKRFGVSIAIAHLFLLQGTTGYATDIEAGEKLFKRCVACHTIDKGGKNKVGPNLYGIVGAPVAANEDFKYSKAMKSYAGEWTPERLDAFLTNPRKEVKKTKPVVIEAPEYFLDALETNTAAKATFEGFSPSNKKDYLEWITGAKTEKTRDKRLAQALEWMAEGKVRNWKYIK